MREAQELANSPSPDYTAAPLETDLFEWHFTLRGPPGSAYSEGVYHGRITLPPTYPLRPPNFRFVTPNGRFETNREICLSISGHHEETWQPAWGVRTAIVALRSFMETEAEGQIGGLNTTDDRRRHLAIESKSFKCLVCNKTNTEIIAECEDAAKNAAVAGSSSKEVEIPEELRMGFRDEIEKKEIKKQEEKIGREEDAYITPTPTRLSQPSMSGIGSTVGAVPRVVTREDSVDSEMATLAEGFVQTTVEAPDLTQTEPYPSARPGQGPTQPTARPTAPFHLDIAQQPAQANRMDWVDWAIYSVVFMLIAMIIKVLVK